MKKRIFIATNLPENIKAATKKEIDRLAVVLPEWARFVPEDNWHLTIVTNQGNKNFIPISSLRSAML